MSRRMSELKDGDVSDDERYDVVPRRDRSLARARSDTDDLPQRRMASVRAPPPRRKTLVRAHSVSALARRSAPPQDSRHQLLQLVESCNCGASEEQARRLFVALEHERNTTLRQEALEFSVSYHRCYETQDDFRQAYAEWSRGVALFKQTSFEFWLKEQYQSTIWQAACRAATLDRVMHLGDHAEHAGLTDTTAKLYEVPYRHRISFSAQSAETSTLFFVLYTADAVFRRCDDWVVERDDSFWNCFYCIPRDVVRRLYGGGARVRVES